MKILLVYPPPIPLLTKNRNEDNRMLGLGLMYLATAVCKNHDVTILGGAVNPTPVEDMIEQITKLEPDILGISTIFSTLAVSGKKIAQEIKRRLPDTLIIFGGNHATFTAGELVKEPYVDIVVKGEGEITFKELIERIERDQPIDDVRGIVFKTNGEVVTTPLRPAISDIDTIPFPDWSLIYDKMPVHIPLCSSRGCPNDCIYCSTTSFWGRKWRYRSAQNMIDEIKHIFDTYQPEKKSLYIAFVDDNFTVDRKRVKEFCRLVGQEDFELKWGGSSRMELIDPELMGIMSDAGCDSVFFGIESGSNRLLKKLNRRYTTDEVKVKVQQCMDVGIIPICSFMIGNPYEDKSDIEETFALIKTLKSYYCQVHIFTPLIGTEVFHNAEKYGVELITEKYDDMKFEAKALLNTRYLKSYEIEKLYHKGVGFVLKRFREAGMVKKIVEKNKSRRLKPGAEV